MFTFFQVFYHVSIQLTVVDVILLCQLNRNLAARSDKRPTLTDLRDSGSIEEFSHIVIGLYKEDDNDQQETQEIEIHALKNRNGPTGMKKAMFYKRYSIIAKLVKHITPANIEV